VFLSKKNVHVLSKFVSFLVLFCWLVLKKIFVLFLGLGQEAQQVMCGAIGLGQQTYLPNLLMTFNMYIILQPFFFLLYTPCLLGVLTFYIHLAWFVSVPSFFVN
jgi:hypothetical protein